MEIHKYNEQTNYLEMEVNESMKKIRAFLIQHDKTEFAEENAE